LDVKDTHTGDTALHLAARCGRVELALALLESGANPNVSNEMGETVLHACVRLVHRMQARKPIGATASLFLLKELLARGADGSICTKPCSGVPIPLLNGAKMGAQASRDCSGAQTPLHWAVANGEVDSWKACETLVHANKNLANVHDGAGLCPVAVALDLLNESTACRLLPFKSDLNEPMGDKEETLLHIACRRALVKGAEELIRLKVYLSPWDLEGLTPLHAGAGHDTIVSVFCGVGPDKSHLNARTEHGVPVLHRAIHLGNARSVELLLRAGVDFMASESLSRFGPLDRAVATETCVKTGVAIALLNFITLPGCSKEKKARTKLEELIRLGKEPDEAPPPLPKAIPAGASPSLSPSKRSQLEALFINPATDDSAAKSKFATQQQHKSEVSRRLEDNARETAELFLKQDAGQRILQRMAQEICAKWVDDKDSLSMDAALEFARREFIKQACEDALMDLKQIQVE